MAIGDDVSRGVTAKASEPTDLTQDLMAIAASQDQGAYRRLFHEITPRLKSFLMGQGTVEPVAEEILQETMLKVWQKARQFDGSKASASTWIYTIARNAKIDRFRKEARPMPDPNDPSYIQDPPETGEQSVAKKQESNHIREAIATLPSDQLRIITMSFYEEKSHAEISEELELPLGTVKSRIRLAFGKIRNELKDMA
ncbi:MAG: sigma-70 family RNA polymerase sigma factor [Sneathiella sp.]|uniref:sigma-70 family RNA polymerase sigma factor n=1 Tax=Sneathiella sp. TaxID=1964365 RepID=UPI003002B21E